MGKTRRGRGAQGKSASHALASDEAVLSAPSTPESVIEDGAIAGIDSMDAGKRAMACHSIETSLSVGSSAQSAAVASRLLSTRAVRQLMALLFDPVAEVVHAATGALKALIEAAGAAGIEKILDVGVAQSLVILLTKCSNGPALAAAAEALLVVPEASKGPSPQGNALHVASDAFGALTCLLQGSSRSVEAIMRGASDAPPEGDLPLGAVLLPTMAALELPTALGGTIVAGNEASVWGAQEVAAEFLHVFAENNAAFQAALDSSAERTSHLLERLDAVMLSPHSSPLASLHVAGGTLQLCRGRAVARTGNALAVAVKAIQLSVLGERLSQALADWDAFSAAKEGLQAATRPSASAASARRDVAFSEVDEDAASEATATIPPSDAVAEEEAAADEAKFLATERRSASSIKAWKQAGPDCIALASEILASATADAYQFRSVAGADDDDAAEDVDVIVTSADATLASAIVSLGPLRVSSAALVSLLRLLNGSAAAGGDSVAAAVLLVPWAREGVSLAVERLSSLVGVLASVDRSDPALARWERLGALLSAADWRAPADASSHVAVARALASKAALQGLLAAAQVSLEYAHSCGLEAELATAAAAVSALAAPLCATAASGAEHSPVTSPEARALALGCLSELPHVVPSVLGNAAALVEIAKASMVALRDPAIEVVTEAFNCIFDVFGADGDAVLPTASASRLAPAVDAAWREAQARLKRDSRSLEPDVRARCKEMIDNAKRFVSYLKSSRAD
jgi:hypothetical protein